MKKSIVFFLTVIMLLGIISCSNEQPTKVTKIDFTQETFNVSSVDISNHGEKKIYLVVESMTPSSAENKEITYTLNDGSIPGLEANWSDVVTVSEEDGLVTFSNPKKLDLSKVHSSVTVTAACGNATTDITFKLNLKQPKDINLVFGENDVYSTTKDGTLIIDLITNGGGYSSVKLNYAFETSEDPSIKYPENFQSDVISFKTNDDGTTSIIAKDSGYQEVTLYSGYEDDSEETEKVSLTFGVYVNAVRTADDLKAFLNDDTTADTGDRKKQLNSATSAYIVNDISDLTNIKTNLKSCVKNLDLNGKALSFKENSSRVGFDLSSNLNAVLKIDGEKESSRIVLENSVVPSATLFRVENSNDLTISYGSYSAISPVNATVISSSESSIMLGNGEFVAIAPNANTLDLSGSAYLVGLTVLADGGNKANALVSSSGSVELLGGSYTAFARSGNATALDLNNCAFNCRDKKITVEAKAYDGRATGISFKGDYYFKMSEEISEVSTIEAYGSSAVGFMCDSVKSSLNNVKITVIGTDDSSDKIVKDFSVIGMLCNSDVDVSGDITVNVSTSTRIIDGIPKTPTITSASKNLCAVYNAKNAEITFRSPKVKVSAVAERGGAYALYNEGTISFTGPAYYNNEGTISFRGADSTFTASRKYDVINNQDNTVLDPERNALLYSVYNDEAASISIINGSMSFITKSPNMVDCTYLRGPINTNIPVSFETLPYLPIN